MKCLRGLICASLLLTSGDARRIKSSALDLAAKSRTTDAMTGSNANETSAKEPRLSIRERCAKVHQATPREGMHPFSSEKCKCHRGWELSSHCGKLAGRRKFDVSDVIFNDEGCRCVRRCSELQALEGCEDCESGIKCNSCTTGFELKTKTVGGVEVTTCHFACLPEQSSAGCTECIDKRTCTRCAEDTHELKDGKCVLPCTAQQKADGCERCRDANTCTSCQAGHQKFFSKCLADSLHEAGGCDPAPEGGQYYTYRATDDTNYPPNGINTASAGGVMRYVHTEVVGIDCCAPVPRCVRKYNIDRIRRYKVTMRNVGDPRRFRNFVQFEKGQCTLPGCVNMYQRQGYNVGCQIQDVQHFHYKDAAWMSFPGYCVSRQFNAKNATACPGSVEPGGECPRPVGGYSCTYHLEEAGEVFLDELVGIGPPGSFTQWCRSGGREFVLHPEAWKGDQPDLDFWKERKNVELNALRTKALVKAFRDKYPDTPELPGCGER